MANRRGIFDKLCERGWEGNLIDHPVMSWDMPLIISFLAVEESLKDESNRSHRERD